MAAYDLVLAKMMSVEAASAPAAKPSKKKRKRPDTQISSAIQRPPSPSAPEAANGPLPSSQSKKHKSPKDTTAPSSTAEPSQHSMHQPKGSKARVKTATAVDVPTAVLASVKNPPVAAQNQRARGRHIGRYHKVAAAKKAGSYSKSDLAAILGVDSLPVAAPSSATPVAEASSDDQVTSDALQESAVSGY